jgi:Na+/proline symporter
LFLTKVPDDYFDLVHGPYDWLFIVSYAVYHLYMLGGKWPYVQRYTSVPNERSARKVAALFGVLYIFNPVLFFLPAMLYRAVDPTMTGLEVENAFILMARRVLPAGLVGLMLAAMLSSSASAANTMLNMLSAVFTQDIYHNLIRRNASERSLMVVARLSTFLFGAAMIGVALMVPHIGGLVEMILSIAAITGGATLLPPIWALFSKRISSASAIWASVLALAISLFFKLVTPALFGIRLSRAMEMTVGVGVPTVALLAIELALWRRRKTSPGVARFDAHKRGLKPAAAHSLQSRFGARVVAYSTVYIGACLFLLGWFAPHARLLVTGIAAGVLAGGALAVWLGRRKPDREPGPEGGVPI